MSMRAKLKKIMGQDTQMSPSPVEPETIRDSLRDLELSQQPLRKALDMSGPYPITGGLRGIPRGQSHDSRLIGPTTEH